MKKLIWLFPLFVSACGGGGKSSGTPPVSVPIPHPQVDNLACDQVKLLGRMYSGTSATFYVNTLILAMETFASQCSPQDAAAVLDRSFHIACSDICVVKEK
ncbi:hypothetical protein [Bdellovibrio sp. BCCA]|uniref:hypothetical protein n=1 Tax=Bdellovibrio sp. BCCA TaxID=3136281 RepID=UPI0030F34321